MSTVTPEHQEVSAEQALVIHESNSPAVWLPTFAVSVDQMIGVVKEKQRFMSQIMEDGQHYGVIPGTNDRKVLLKPGAELLLASMGLSAELVNAEPPIIDLMGKDHGGEAFVMYQRACLVHRYDSHTGERVLVARAEGSCNSWEKKYRYRTAGRVCPDCGKSTIMESSFEDSKGDFYCHKKVGGCGHKFKKGSEAHAALAKVEVGRVPNPEIAEIANTILKMADKRALVAATLIATGFSQDFTQDVEEDEKFDVGPDYDGYVAPIHQSVSSSQSAHADGNFTAPVGVGGATGSAVAKPSGEWTNPPADDDSPWAGMPEFSETLPATAAVTASVPQTGTEQPANGQKAPEWSSSAKATPSQLDVLTSLSDDLPPSAMFNRIKVKALLGKTGETPSSVLEKLFEAHRKAHDGECIHIKVALTKWL
jgi:hypothetical protein